MLDQFESSRKNNKILDIGCGDGHFLTAALARGWEVHGTEFTDDAIEICKKKNINVQQGILDAKNYSSIQFDVITSFEVIEHINNPKTELENIKTILRSGGILYLTTPNFNSISRFILKGKWNIITYPEHLSYYTAKTMNRFLSKNGFRKIKLQTTGISINRLQQSSSVLKSDSETNKDESLREKTESYILLQGIKKSINFFLNLFRMGDTIKGTYKKQ